MSYIPDCRNDENYNEKFLSEDDSNVIVGYDICVEDGIENFFDNVDVYEDLFDIAGMNAESGFDFSSIDHNLLSQNQMLEDLSPEEIQNVSKATLLFLAIKQAILHWAEMHRDETITSMLDNMDETEYYTIKSMVERGNYQNAVVRRNEYLQQLHAGEVPTCWEIKKGSCNRGYRKDRALS